MRISLRFSSLMVGIVALAAVVAACSQDLAEVSGADAIGKSCGTQSDCPYFLVCDVGACRQRCSASLACRNNVVCSARGTCIESSTTTTPPGDDVPGDDVAGDDVSGDDDTTSDGGPTEEQNETVRDDLPANVVSISSITVGDDAQPGWLYVTPSAFGAAYEGGLLPIFEGAGIASDPILYEGKIYFARDVAGSRQVYVTDTTVSPYVTTSIGSALTTSAVQAGVYAGVGWLAYQNTDGRVTLYNMSTGALVTPLDVPVLYFAAGGEGIQVAQTADGTGQSSLYTIYLNAGVTYVQRTLRIFPAPETATAAILIDDSKTPAIDLYTVFTAGSLTKVNRYEANLDSITPPFAPANTTSAPAVTVAASGFHAVLAGTAFELFWASDGTIYRVPLPKGGFAKSSDIARTSLAGKKTPVTVLEQNGYIYWIEPTTKGTSALKRKLY